MIKKLSTIFLVVLFALTAAGCIKQGSLEQSQVTDPVITGQNQITQQSSESYTVTGVEGKTALEALRAKHKIETKEFPGLGQFIQTIEGKTPDSSHYWAFYVNGTSSNVGASQYIAKKGDTFEFRLEEIKEQ
jgi:hypothetical protein